MTDKPIWEVVGTLECGCPKTQDDWNKMCGACAHFWDPCEGVSCDSDANECEYFSRISMFGALPDLPSYEDVETKILACPRCMTDELHYKCESGWMCAECENVKKEEVKSMNKKLMAVLVIAAILCVSIGGCLNNRLTEEDLAPLVESIEGADDEYATAGKYWDYDEFAKAEYGYSRAQDKFLDAADIAHNLKYKTSSEDERGELVITQKYLLAMSSASHDMMQASMYMELAEKERYKPFGNPNYYIEKANYHIVSANALIDKARDLRAELT